MGARKRVIIDTDAGVDDAQAILMALNCPDVDVIAITTCHGNVDSIQVCKNVLRLLNVVDRLDIPVYHGANKSLVGRRMHAQHYHGIDGFGDVPDPDAPDISMMQPEHAVTALQRLVAQHKGEVTLVCLSPLTNVALAIRLDTEFGRNLKACYLMGGNYEGKGNITVSAEFNFYADPEAAKVVLGELECPITLVPWEICLKHALSWDWYIKFVQTPTKKARLLKEIEFKRVQQTLQSLNLDFTANDVVSSDGSSALLNETGNDVNGVEKKTSSTKSPLSDSAIVNSEYPDYILADQFVMAILLADETVASVRKNVYCTVNTQIGLGHGMMMVDWSGSLGKPPNVDLIMDVNIDEVKDMLTNAVQ